MKRIVFLVLASLVVFTACKKEFTITVKSNNESWGKVSGGGTYAKGQEIKIAATPNLSIYKFVKWEDGNTDNPRTIVVKKEATYTAIFEQSGGGYVPDDPDEPVVLQPFSVGENTTVYFSPGNLQWSATNGGNSVTVTTHAVAGGGTASGTWRFAPNQWDTIGAGNSNSYSGWMDLFGWGTSGYNSKYPNMTSTTYSDYGNGRESISGTNYDWGVYNAIYNPQTKTTDAPGTWRTLTSGEWRYLLGTRTTTSGMRYAKALVNGVGGVIILPDNWNRNTYTLNGADNINTAYTSNNIDIYDWSMLEHAGCVFLPAAGIREGTSVRGVGSYGYYWCGNWCLDNSAYDLFFSSTSLNPVYDHYRYVGNSVRLVKNVQ
ncbi:MAG: hypothetical protein J5606_05485 [Bacteroidales bacterium]|nr:hypothetical protein [Bacteroidales bacterium]